MRRIRLSRGLLNGSLQPAELWLGVGLIVAVGSYGRGGDGPEPCSDFGDWLSASRWTTVCMPLCEERVISSDHLPLTAAVTTDQERLRYERH